MYPSCEHTVQLKSEALSLSLYGRLYSSPNGAKSQHMSNRDEGGLQKCSPACVFVLGLVRLPVADSVWLMSGDGYERSHSIWYLGA